MRTEQVIAKALEKLDDDRYVLSNMIFARVKELSKGAQPLVDMDIKKHKLSDIAIMEIAEGKIKLEEIQEIRN